MDIEKFRVNVQPTLEWLKAGAPHTRVGVYDDIGFDMDYIVHDRPTVDYNNNACGTTCCIAGHALLSSGHCPQDSNNSFYDAGDYLGLNGVEMYQLFCATNSRDDLEYITPEMAVRTIEHAIETGKIVWDFNHDE